MDSNFLTLVLFCWILTAGVLATSDSSPTQFFNIAGNRTLRRLIRQTIDPDELMFTMTEFNLMKYYVGLMTKDLSEELQLKSQLKNRDAPIHLRDSYVNVGNETFLISKLHWGEDPNDDSVLSLQSCLPDLVSMSNQKISFKVNFTRSLKLSGNAEKVILDDSEDDPDNASRKVRSPPLNRIDGTCKPSTSAPKNPSVEVTPELLPSAPANPGGVDATPLRENSKPSPEACDEEQEDPSVAALHDRPPQPWIGVATKFAIFIENAQFNVQYVRVPTLSQGIVSEEISEEVTFEKLKVENRIFEMQGLSVDQQMKFEDEMSFLEKLADSWMVNLIDAINHRYIKPNMVELSRSLFKAKHNGVLQLIGDVVLQSLLKKSFLWRGKPLKTEDRLLLENPIDEIELQNFNRFRHFARFSTSNVIQELGSCSFNEIYSHTLVFDYYMPSTAEASIYELKPSIGWHPETVNQTEETDDLISHRPKFINEETFLTVTRFSVKLIVNTDKLGKTNSLQVETSVPMDVGPQLDNGEFHWYIAAIFKTAERLMSECVKQRMEFNL